MAPGLRVVARVVEPVGEFVDLLFVFLLGFGEWLRFCWRRLRSRKIAVSIVGQSMTMATLFLMSMSLMVQPARWIAEAWPPRRFAEPRESKPPLAGTARTSVMPAARVTGMCSLDGRMASAATASGIESAGFGGVHGGADGGDFAEAHLGNGIEEARVDLQAFAVDDLRARGNVDVGADGGDFAVLDDEDAIVDWRAG